MRLLFCLESGATYPEMLVLLKALAKKNHRCSVLLSYDVKRQKIAIPERDALRALHDKGIVDTLSTIDLGEINQRASDRTRPTQRFKEVPIPKAPIPTPPSSSFDHPFITFATRYLNLPAVDARRTPNRVKEGREIQDGIFVVAKWSYRQLVHSQKRFYVYIKPFRRSFSRIRRSLPTIIMNNVRARLRAILNSRVMLRIRRCRLTLVYYTFFLEEVRIVFRTSTFDAIILPEEVVGMVWESLIKTSNEFGLPVIVCPYTIANQEEAFRSLSQRHDHQTRNNWLVAHLFPRWRMREDDRDLVRLPEAHIVAHERLRLTPQDPWLMNSGTIDALCVESRVNERYFIESGIHPEQIHVTGSATMDEMHEILQQRQSVATQLATEMGCEDDRPLLLISGCPNQLDRCPYCEHVSMQDIADFVAHALSPLMEPYRCVIRPHPSYIAFGDMLAPYGFHVSTLPTAQLVALSQLFIAFASSTIRWAVCCGVPTINYDVFFYDYREYKDTIGVFNVKTKEKFSETTSKFSDGDSFYRETKGRIRSQGGMADTFDGRAVDRIDTLLESLVTKPRSSTR